MTMPRGNMLKNTPLWIGAILLILVALPSFSAPLGQIKAKATGNSDLDAAINTAIKRYQAKIYVQEKSWDKAAMAYKEVIAAGTDGEKSHHKLAMILKKAGKQREALKLYKKLLKKGPNADAYFQVAALYAEMGDKAALDYLEKAVDAGYNNAEDLMDDHFSHISDESRFLSLLKNILGAKKKQKEAKKALKRDELETAIARFGEALEFTPKNAKLYHSLSLAQMRAGQLVQARESLQHQLDLNFKQGLTHYNLACTYALDGTSDKAIEHLQTAVAKGFTNLKHIKKDSDLDSLRDLADFRNIVESLAESKGMSRRLKAAIKSEEEARILTVLADLQDHELSQDLDDIALDLLRKGLNRAAELALEKEIIAGYRDTGRALYNMACAQALQGETDKALISLQNATAAGFINGDHMANDSDLDSLKENAKFQEILKQSMDQAKLRHSWKKSGKKHWDVHMEHEGHGDHHVEWHEGQSGDHHMEQYEGHHERQSGKHHMKKRYVVKKMKNHSKMGFTLFNQKDYAGAIKAFQMQDEMEESGNNRYNIACCYALSGNADKAFDWLNKAHASGYSDAGHMKQDGDLISLREDPRFKALLEQMN